MYLTEFSKSIVWFHYLKAFQTVKMNPSMFELPFINVKSSMRVYLDSTEKSKL